MSANRIFIDTNILLYAHDADAGKKYNVASDLVLRAWDGFFEPVVSIQVLQEFLVNLRKKLSQIDQSIFVVTDYMEWYVVENDLFLFQNGIEIMTRYRLSLWDAMIIAASQRAGAELLYSEDLNDGQIYGSVRVENPLKNS